MPYFITDKHPDCSAWATVKGDGELMACHPTKQAAIDQMVAVSLSEKLEPGGTYQGDFRSEIRAVDLTPPAYMRAAARRGLRLYEEGKGGDGLVDRTIREARAMAAGNVTADKWVRLRAWIARHLVDLDAPSANPSNEDYPSPGVVAHLLWGSPATKSGARRALAYAEGIVARLESENRELVSVEAREMAKIETRMNTTTFEVRDSDEGMIFEGYAAVFNSASHPLPFTERIAPGAFKRSLRSRNDIKLLWNHDVGEILGSTRGGSLSLEEDAKGLFVRAILPNTTRGRDTAELLKRGDVNAMSFGFSVPSGGDEWNAEGTERTLRSVRLHEISVVGFPAYPETSASVRSINGIATRAEVDVDILADALQSIELGEELTQEQIDAINKVAGVLSPKAEEAPVAEETPAEEEPQAPEVSAELLEVKKKKLELLMKGIQNGK